MTSEEKLAKVLYEKYDVGKYVPLDEENAVEGTIYYSHETETICRIKWVRDGYTCAEIIKKFSDIVQKEEGDTFIWGESEAGGSEDESDNLIIVLESESKPWDELDEFDKHLWLEDARELLGE